MMNAQPNKQTVLAWARLLKIQRVLLERIERSLKRAGLPPLAWYDVLLELRREKEKGLRQYEIGERILLSKHNLSRLLDRLAAKNLIQRCLCTEDGRGNVVKITPDGRALLKEMWPVYARAIRENFSSALQPEEIDALSRFLFKLLNKNKNPEQAGETSNAAPPLTA